MEEQYDQYLDGQPIDQAAVVIGYTASTRVYQDEDGVILYRLTDYPMAEEIGTVTDASNLHKFDEAQENIREEIQAFLEQEA